jgi:hypothetical protein
MDFDGQHLFNTIIALCGALGGWILKTIWDAIKEIKRDVKDLNREVNQDFVRKDDFRDAVKRIEDMLGKIFDKLDGKADKGD